VAGAIALGPVFGWWAAISSGAFPQAFELLIPLTVACLVPLIAWTLRRQPWLLALAGFLWFTSGFYFAVGMWI
jgi:hypothetical protein